MGKSYYRIYKRFTGIAFIAVILSVPLAFILPVEFSFENGLLENAQVLVLILAAVILIVDSKSDSQIKWFQRFFAMGLLLMAMRELSWGRVFFPVGNEELGSVFVSMAEYKYRVRVYVFLAAYISTMLFILIRFIPVKKILLGRQPLGAFAVIILAIVFSYIGDHGYLIGKAHGQILEELNELILYLTLPVAALYYRAAW